MGAPSGEFLRLIAIGGLSDQFLRNYMGAPQTSFFAYYMGVPSDLFLHILYGGPLKSVSSLTIWGPPTGQFLRLLYGAPLLFFFIFLCVKLSLGGPIFFNCHGGQVPPLAPPPPDCLCLCPIVRVVH